MRVIAGQYKNRHINSVKGEWLRPTTDRTREFIFSYLGNLVPGTRVLDLFAGTGSLGLEAMSRGAQEVTFVDSSTAALALLKRNTEELGIPARIYRQQTQAFLKLASKNKWRYDLIFCDPPYRYQEIVALLDQVQTGGILDSEGFFVYEMSSRDAISCPESWLVQKAKVMGDTQILFYRLFNGKKNSHLPGLV